MIVYRKNLSNLYYKEEMSLAKISDSKENNDMHK